MNRTITIAIDGKEAAILLDSLDTEIEIYRRSAQDAIGDGNHDLAATLESAADRIAACRIHIARSIAAAATRN